MEVHKKLQGSQTCESATPLRFKPNSGNVDVQRSLLFLEGVPNVQKIGRIQVGLSVKEVLEADLKCEHINFNDLKKFAAKAEELQDYVSRDLFVSILKSEEEHIDWLESQLHLIQQMGIENYIQSHMEQLSCVLANFCFLR